MLCRNWLFTVDDYVESVDDCVDDYADDCVDDCADDYVDDCVFMCCAEIDCMPPDVDCTSWFKLIVMYS